MSTERPPIERAGGVGAPSNDVEDEHAPGAKRAPDAEKEFEFSHLVLGEEIPFALPMHRVERGWARLANTSHSASALAPAGERNRLTGVLVAFAACAATFAAGVWVGEGQGGRGGSGASARVMSAEPVSVALPSGNLLAETQRAEPSSKTAGAATTTSVAADWRPPDTNDVEPARVVGATRLGHGVRPSVNVPSGATAATGVLPAPVYTTEVAAAVTASAVGAPVWQRLAYDGDYEGALVEITAAGGFERVLQLASAEQLMLLSDVARGTGQQQRALAALRRIVSEHAADPVAPLAALNMGNLLDKMGDGAGATRAFAVYRALSPKGDFAEDALVRQIRSAVGAGQQDLARRLVHQYEVDFPEGRQADEVARWAEQIPTRAEAGDAGAPTE